MAIEEYGVDDLEATSQCVYVEHWTKTDYSVYINGRPVSKTVGLSVAVTRGVKVGVGVRDDSAVIVAIMTSKSKGFCSLGTIEVCVALLTISSRRSPEIVRL